MSTRQRRNTAAPSLKVGSHEKLALLHPQPALRAQGITVIGMELNKRNMLLHPIKWQQEFYERERKADRSEEIFWHQAYHWLAERLRPGTTVLDLGANIGDSAIYFAQFREAKEVRSYEVSPWYYARMLENLKACPIGNKVSAFNAGIGSIDHTIKVGYGMPTGVENINDYASLQGKEVRVLTLGHALRGLRNVVIKCDIEGAEAGIFADADLSQVYAMIVEWHSMANRGKIAQELGRQRFRFRYGPSEPEAHFGRIGHIYAWREGGKP